MIFEVIKILILKTIAMKNSFFSKTLVIIFLFGGLSASAQVRVKTNSNNNKKVVVKPNRSNHHNDRGGVRVKTNRNRVVVSKPNRPQVILQRPVETRRNYIWAEGHWQWSNFYGDYIWIQGKWIRQRRGHHWEPGFWEISLGGFVWIEGYWAR